MPEFFLELFSEEIPARMQFGAGISLKDICEVSLQEINFKIDKFVYGPRRIAIKGQVNATREEKFEDVKGPREGSPPAALEGFLKKYKATQDQLIVERGAYYLRRAIHSKPAFETILENLGPALARFPWPKVMRWGQSGNFSWVRPLRSVACLLDDVVVPVTVGPITASNKTLGHRSRDNHYITISGASDWEEQLYNQDVIADPAERRNVIVQKLVSAAGRKGLLVVHDPALVDEVTGLVEWPFVLIGAIEPKFMSLPAEVRELSMKVNQKYFALRDADGNPAPYFGFVANLDASDGGTAIIAGNERVLRARLADAQHFWDVDIKTILTTNLDDVLKKLAKIVFHAKLGSQKDRVIRLQAIAIEIATILGGDDSDIENANAAALFCKADLISLMVSEFPELQGVIGGYYAGRMIDHWKPEQGIEKEIVGAAIKSHYQPKGPADNVPRGIVAASVALADKIDTLREFFRVGEVPTGSGDPYALRRAALGVIRIILENKLRLPLDPLLNGDEKLFGFLIERLRVKLRGEGKRFDVLDAVLGAATDDDLVRIMRRVEAVSDLLATDDGANLLTAYRRAANISRIEDAKDGPHHGDVAENFVLEEERNLAAALTVVRGEINADLSAGRYDKTMTALARLRAPVDDFFDKVTVNAPEPSLRLNRLRLLALLRDTMHQIADFSKIQG